MPQGGVTRDLNYSIAPWGAGFELFVISSTASDGSASQRGYTPDGFEVLRSQKSFDGTWFHTRINYLDRLPIQVSLPYTDGEVPTYEKYTQFHYDTLRRLTHVVRPDSEKEFVTTRLVHRPTPFETIELDGLGQAKRTITDVHGRPLQTRVGYARLPEFGELARVAPVFEPSPGRTTYEYRAFGNLRFVDREEAEFFIRRGFQRDVLGRVTKTEDDDAGINETFYNSFGEIRRTLDAARQQTTYHRDPLGRTLSASGPDDRSFVWDRDHFGTLAEAHSSDGVSTFLSYDDLGRPIQKRLLLDGATYDLDYHYDHLGRIRQIDYPNPDSGVQRFRVGHDYNEHGYLKCVLDARNGTADGCTGQAPRYWTALSVTPFLQEEGLGNDTTTTHTYDQNSLLLTNIEIKNGQNLLQHFEYEYHDNGQVQTRTEHQTGLTDQYAYDEIGQLERWTRGARTESYHYDLYNRIDYVDVVAESGAPAERTDYEYAIESIIRPQAPLTIGNLEYRYDDHGRRYETLSTRCSSHRDARFRGFFSGKGVMSTTLAST